MAGETVAVGAAILGAGKLIGGGLAAVGLIGAGTGIGTVFGALITGKSTFCSLDVCTFEDGPIYLRRDIQVFEIENIVSMFFK